MISGHSRPRLATLRRSVTTNTLLRSVAKQRIGTFLARCFFLPLLLCISGAAPLDDDLGEVGDFALTERSGHTVRNADLQGKIWIASFVFTRCTAGCPQITTTMKRLQDDLAGYPDVRLVTFTVDPKNDDPATLREYADHFGADPQRWLFLTGEQDEIYHLLESTFHLPARQNEGDEPHAGQRSGPQLQARPGGSSGAHSRFL